jgi:hypothetical protein
MQVRTFLLDMLYHEDATFEAKQAIKKQLCIAAKRGLMMTTFTPHIHQREVHIVFDAYLCEILSETELGNMCRIASYVCGKRGDYSTVLPCVAWLAAQSASEIPNPECRSFANAIQEMLKDTKIAKFDPELGQNNVQFGVDCVEFLANWCNSLYAHEGYEHMNDVLCNVAFKALNPYGIDDIRALNPTHKFAQTSSLLNPHLDKKFHEMNEWIIQKYLLSLSGTIHDRVEYAIKILADKGMSASARISSLDVVSGVRREDISEDGMYLPFKRIWKIIKDCSELEALRCAALRCAHRIAMIHGFHDKCREKCFQITDTSPLLWETRIDVIAKL